jgi:ketosteroid isomerase-like protein
MQIESFPRNGGYMGNKSHDEIEAVTRAWEKALANHDPEALLACYAADATLESPVAAHVLGGRGVVRGHDELRPFLEEVLARTPDERHYHRETFFTDGRRAIWEYPRQTPDGEQMDFVEVMEIEHGLIQSHRVYWGWRGVEILNNDEYHRES